MVSGVQMFPNKPIQDSHDVLIGHPYSVPITPGKRLQFAIENGHRNSGFSH